MMMKSLFEKQEREESIRGLKIDLISRFYPLTNIEVVKYKDTLNFDGQHLMKNESIQWDIDLVETLKEKIDWSEIWKLKKLKIGIPFIKKFETLIDFESLQSSDNIEWSDELIEQYGDKFNWETWLINKEPLSTTNNLRRFKDKLDWSRVSRGVKLKFTDEIIEEFKDKWEWKKLSANENLPVDLDFLKQYADRLNFDELSQNPAALSLIYSFPENQNWNWNRVILNRGIIYNQETFDFMFSNVKKYWEAKDSKMKYMKGRELQIFLYRIFIGYWKELSFFLNETFIPFLPWDIFSKLCRSKLSLGFLEMNKDKLDFKESALINLSREAITSDFILKNHTLFNKKSYSFYYLPLSISLIQNFIEDINWNLLSSCETLDWSWEFIETNFERWNFYCLGKNKGIYNKLIAENHRRSGILKTLKQSSRQEMDDVKVKSIKEYSPDEDGDRLTRYAEHNEVGHLLIEIRFSYEEFIYGGGLDKVTVTSKTFNFNGDALLERIYELDKEGKDEFVENSIADILIRISDVDIKKLCFKNVILISEGKWEYEYNDVNKVKLKRVSYWKNDDSSDTYEIAYEYDHHGNPINIKKYQIKEGMKVFSSESKFGNEYENGIIVEVGSNNSIISYAYHENKNLAFKKTYLESDIWQESERWNQENPLYLVEIFDEEGRLESEERFGGSFEQIFYYEYDEDGRLLHLQNRVNTIEEEDGNFVVSDCFDIVNMYRYDKHNNWITMIKNPNFNSGRGEYYMDSGKIETYCVIEYYNGDKSDGSPDLGF